MMWGRRKGLIAVAVVALLAGAFAGWMWAQNLSAAQNEQRSDLELFLDASSAGWAEATDQFFRTPEVAAQTIGALAAQMQTTDQRLTLLAETIRERPNIDSAYIGYPDGSFYFAGRSDEFAPGGFRTRVIDFDDNGQRRVELTWTDASLQIIDAELTPEDQYDPRLRPWFEPIVDGHQANWTAPYVFASSELPGITFSRGVRDSAGQLESVVGVDIRLSRINEFLEVLSPGTNGSALVVDDGGQIIAESTMDVANLDAAGEDSAVHLSHSTELRGLIDDLAAANQDTLRERSLDGARTTVVRPTGARDEWYLAVEALDEDFLSDDTASNALGTFAVSVTAAAAAAALGLLGLRYLSGLKAAAEIDELTGLLNRRAIKRQLVTLLNRSKGPVHVALIDLDNFKTINDENGHATGDQVLVAASQRMRSFSEHADMTLGRLGGDEFVMFGEGTEPDWAELTRSLAQPVTVDGHVLAVTASVGITQSATAELAEIDELLRSADHVLFDAKRHGGDRYHIANET